jgi:hypothetical protein
MRVPFTQPFFYQVSYVVAAESAQCFWDGLAKFGGHPYIQPGACQVNFLRDFFAVLRGFFETIGLADKIFSWYKISCLPKTALIVEKNPGPGLGFFYSVPEVSHV